MAQTVEYIGDGLYAEHDGYQFLLKANHHQHPTDTVALNDKVFGSFLRFAEKTLNLKITVENGE